MFGRGVRVFGLIFFTLICAGLYSSGAHAAEGSWREGSFTFGERQSLSPDSQSTSCVIQKVLAVGVNAVPLQLDLCVYERPSFRYAGYSRYINMGYYGYSEYYFLLSIGNDRSMYTVNGMSSQRMPIDVPDSDDLHFSTLTMGFTNNHRLSYIPQFHRSVSVSTNPSTLNKQYDVTGSEQPFIPFDLSGREYVTTGAHGVSKNGKWMAVELMGTGLVLIDTRTREIHGFSGYKHGYGYGSDARIKFVVSNDGAHVATFDYNITPTVYTLDQECVVRTGKVTELFQESLRPYRVCPDDESRLLNALVEKTGSYQASRSEYASEFSSDGNTLYFDSYEYDMNDWMNPKRYRMPLYSGNYVPDTSIHYLALGDSFSSGEGDIETKPGGSSYYLPGTEKSQQCHLSERSYPFLLRDALNIDTANMKSVACSGAKVLPDYLAPMSNYLGQYNRLGGIDAEELERKQVAALDEFTPGHIPQLEFIRQYKPKVITLTGGGNDVGFGDILKYCATPSWNAIFADNTCDFAVDGTNLRGILGQSIRDQYDYTQLLIKKIRQASPETTVYIVGYPSFIVESPIAACINSGMLNPRERKMIHQGVLYMNTMLKKAAESTGVKYLDIQDSLHGGRMCEGSKYITGVVGIGFNFEKHQSELFHPNFLGQERIAAAITQQSFGLAAGQNTVMPNEPMTLETPGYFITDETQITTKQTAITEDVIVEESPMAFSISEGMLAPNSTVAITLYSEPIVLPITRTDSKGLLASIVLPKTVKPGRHVLVLEGTSPTGELVRYYQFITVASKNSGDMDGDGIKDSEDPCQFISSWIDEQTNKDVCKVKASANPSPEEQGDNSESSGQGSNGTQQSDARSAESRTVSSGTSEVQESQVDITAEFNTPQSIPEVLGATTNQAVKSMASSMVQWPVLAAIAFISTGAAIYAIVRAIRK